MKHLLLRVSLALPLAAAGVLGSPVAAHAQARPMIERISPTAGPPGTRVQIAGRGFTRAYRVLFNDHVVTPVEVLTERITVVVPEGAQTGTWVLSNGTDEVETELFRVTAPEPAPVIRAVEPATSAPGGEVVLRGEHFDPRPTDNVVRLGALPMVVRAGDGNTLRVIVPDGAQTAPVFVRTRGGEARSATELSIGARLLVREVSPMVVSPGARVTLRGNGFSATAAQNRVTVAGHALRIVRATPTELEAEVPLDGATGTVVIEVPGAGRYETANRLVVGPAPVIRAVEPATAPAGQRVTLRGSNLGADASRVAVTVGGRPARVLTAAPTELVFVVPEGAATGRIGVTADGIGPVETTTDFVVPAALSIARFEPRAADAGDLVTVIGTGFSTDPNADTVTLGAMRCTVERATATELSVRVPPNARSGNWTVAVAGSGSVRSREPFMVTQRPRITAVEPDRGIPGSEVVLRGVNFPPDRTLASVRLNGREVPMGAYSRERIVVTVPRDAQTGRFQVVGRLQGTGTAEMEFFVLQPVTLRAVEPPAGPLGATVTLRGDGFEPDPARLVVRLGPQVIHPTRSSTSEIVFTVPRTSRGGAITVEAEGRQTVTSPEPFAITVPPVVTAVTPARGPVGTRLRITGRNFGAVVGNVGVTLGAVTCPTATVTPTAVECEVPDGAQTGPVTVRVANAGEARARAPFVVTAPAADAGH